MLFGPDVNQRNGRDSGVCPADLDDNDQLDTKHFTKFTKVNYQKAWGPSQPGFPAPEPVIVTAFPSAVSTLQNFCNFKPGR